MTKSLDPGEMHQINKYYELDIGVKEVRPDLLKNNHRLENLCYTMGNTRASLQEELNGLLEDSSTGKTQENNNMRKILIVGSGRHGKDTVAEYLRDEYGVNFLSSSWACAEVLKPTLDIVNGVKSVQEHFDERHDYRELWKALISLFNSADKSALTRCILGKTDVYVGMRSRVEYESSWQLFDTTLYVDASGRVDYVDSTAEIEYDPCYMTLIDNNGSIDDMKRNVDKVIKGVFNNDSTR